MTPQYTCIYIMDRPDLTLSNYMGNSIGPKRVNAFSMMKLNEFCHSKCNSFIRTGELCQDKNGCFGCM